MTLEVARVASRFSHFVAIDWSGAAGARQPGIAVAQCTNGTTAPALVRPGHIWSRSEVLQWLENDLTPASLVGLDLGVSLAFEDCGAFFPGWRESPPDARALWALIDGICANELYLGANDFVDHSEASRHFRRHNGRLGDRFPPGRGRLRRTEEQQRAQGLNPYSNFNLVGAAQVGKSSLTGMRMLHRLSSRFAIWPFDAPTPGQSTIVEIYTSLAAIAAGLPKGRTKIRDGETLDAALAMLDSERHSPLSRYTDHATDALITAAWLRHVADDQALWEPADLDVVRYTEGWTFGVR